MDILISEEEVKRISLAIAFRMKHSGLEQREYWLRLKQELLKYNHFYPSKRK